MYLPERKKKKLMEIEAGITEWSSMANEGPKAALVGAIARDGHPYLLFYTPDVGYGPQNHEDTQENGPADFD